MLVLVRSKKEEQAKMVKIVGLGAGEIVTVFNWPSDIQTATRLDAVSEDSVMVF